MENQSSNFKNIVLLVLGVFVGWLIWGSGLGSNSNVSMTNHMSQMMTDMSEGLKGKTGDDFDKEFLSEMIIHHQGAVDMAKQVLEVSKTPELRKFAEDIISAQSKEINMMEDWEKNGFK